MPKQRREWTRGGLRQRKFRERLDKHFGGEPYLWFVGLQPAGSGFLFRWWGFHLGSASVLAITQEEVHEIPIGGNPVFSFNLLFRHQTTMSLEEANVSFDPDREMVTVHSERFAIYPYHQREAVEFCLSARASMPQWAVNAQ